MAYRKLVLQFHPDRNPGDKTAEAKFRQVQDAYDELTGKGAQQQGTIEQGAPNQQQTPASVEQYKELIQHIMEMNFELYMQKAIDEINNPTHEEIKNMPENDKKEFIEFVLTAPSYKRRIIEHDIGKLNDNIISHFGPLIKKAIDPLNYNMDDISSLCSTILIMILGKIKEEQVKQQQQEDSQEHLLALARQLNNPKIRKGLVYMINGNPGRVSVWAAEIKTPQDLQKNTKIGLEENWLNDIKSSL